MAFTIDKITVGKAYNKDGREVVDLIIDNNYLGSNATLQSMVAGDEELNNWQIGQENLYGLQGVENTPEAIKVAKQRLLDIVVAYEEELATQAQSELEEAAAETIETGETGTQVDDTEPTAPVIAPADTSKKPLTEQDLEREGFITKNLLQQKQLHIKELLDFDFLSDDEKNAIKKAMIEKGFVFDDENYLTKRFLPKTPTTSWNDISSLILDTVNEVRLGGVNTQTGAANPILAGAGTTPPQAQGTTGAGAGAGAGDPQPAPPPQPDPATTPTPQSFQQLADAFVTNANQDTYNAVKNAGRQMEVVYTTTVGNKNYTIYIGDKGGQNKDDIKDLILKADESTLAKIVETFNLAIKIQDITTKKESWNYTENIPQIAIANDGFKGAGRDFKGETPEKITKGNMLEEDLSRDNSITITLLQAIQNRPKKIITPVIPDNKVNITAAAALVNTKKQEQGGGR
jgi:hypothetical protein